jgi:hypothetical protein
VHEAGPMATSLPSFPKPDSAPCIPPEERKEEKDNSVLQPIMKQAMALRWPTLLWPNRASRGKITLLLPPAAKSLLTRLSCPKRKNK